MFTDIDIWNVRDHHEGFAYISLTATSNRILNEISHLKMDMQKQNSKLFHHN